MYGMFHKRRSIQRCIIEADQVALQLLDSFINWNEIPPKEKKDIIVFATLSRSKNFCPNQVWLPVRN